MTTYAPGTVANVTDADGTVRPMILTKDGRRHCWHGARESGSLRCLDATQAEDVRPLVVIDPEDRAKIGQLLKAQVGTSAGCPDALVITNVHIDQMQDALRSLVADPKPEEPTGLGAVVEDESGERWILHQGELAPWHRSDAAPGDRSWRYWSDFAAVRVLSDGVTA